MNFIRKILDNPLYMRSVLIALAALVIIASVVTVAISVDKDGGSSSEVSQPQVETPPPTEPEPEPEPEPEIGLVITAPLDDAVTVTEPHYSFSGTTDPQFPVSINGKEIERNTDGSFTVSVDLEIGKNTFTFTHKEQTVTKTVTYRYVVLKSYTPSDSRKYSSGSVLSISVVARKGSTVTATLAGESVSCQKSEQKNEGGDSTQTDDTFDTFTGTFQLPAGGKNDVSLGKITFKATYSGITETGTSGTITVRKSSVIKDSDPAVTPSGGDYIDVGSGLIATIIARSAETFDGTTTDDTSRAYLNYLPEGTQDYCAEGTVVNSSEEYYKLRCGRRIYTDTNRGTRYHYTIAETSIGTLPDHNEIGIAEFESDGKYTYLKLDTMWKAPFYFELLNQSYQKTRFCYSVSAVTFSYIDITFCYTTVFEGELEIPADHPIFAKAEIIKNDHDCTLRLTLKKTGGLYGWDSYYDENGRLVFKFLNPAKMQNENSLAGITVYIDAGHGGEDSGAAAGGTTENAANLALALKIKERLAALGATAIVNRDSTSTTIYPLYRMNGLRDANADFCVAIHHDQSSKSSTNGFFAAYFTPYSKPAADFIAARTDNADIYNVIWDVEAHYYYQSRVTSCPVVLTENGFISNPHDYNTITTDSILNKKADAIVSGIVDYFRSIQ